MKKEDQPSMSWVPENQASFIAGRGWKSSNCSSLPVEGQKFSLTFPFIEQAMLQACAICSPVIKLPSPEL